MNIITEVARRCDFPVQAAEDLNETFRSITAVKGVWDHLSEARDRLFCRDDTSFTESLQAITDVTGVCRYTVDLLFFLWCAKPLEYIYHLRGLPQQMYLDALHDLLWKLWECKKMHSLWGTMSTAWHPGFYRLHRYAFGRLQFDVASSQENYKNVLRVGDLVLRCHIPSSGPLTEESVKASLRRAYCFFRKKGMLKNDKLVVSCGSWILYPPLLEQLEEHTNMKKFYRLFDMVDAIPSEDNSVFWRIFYVPYSKEALDTVPTDTSLKRIVVRFLKEGGSLGVGKGYIVVDEAF